MSNRLSEKGSRVALYALATAYVGYRLYYSLPRWWHKRYDDDANRSRSLRDANDDLADPAVILQKIRALMQLCSEKVDDDLSWHKMHATFLAYLHLQHELRWAHPEHKRRRYQTGCAPEDTPKHAELVSLLQDAQWAKWAYEDSYLELHERLRETGLDLLRHDTATEPGRVGHFVAVDHKNKVATIAIKGTSSLSDALTDVLGEVVPHTLSPAVKIVGSDGKTTSISTIRAHQGMFTAAQMILDDTSHLVQHFFLPQAYDIRIVGHSLGAGVASLLGLLLQSRVPAATGHVQVRAYATPACLDLSTARALAPFCTSVVNNTDCVPRLSVMNLVSLNKMLAVVHEHLQQKGRAADSWTSGKALVRDLLTVDDDLLLTPDELHTVEAGILQRKQQDQEDHSIFVPGRVVVLCEQEENKKEEEETKSMVTASAGDGGIHVLRFIEVESSMISDHFMDNYTKNLQALVHGA